MIGQSLTILSKVVRAYSVKNKNKKGKNLSDWLPIARGVGKNNGF